VVGNICAAMLALTRQIRAGEVVLRRRGPAGEQVFDLYTTP